MKKKTIERKIKIYVNRNPKYPKPGDIYIYQDNELSYTCCFSPRLGFVEIERMEAGLKYWRGIPSKKPLDIIKNIKESWGIDLGEEA